VDGKKIYKIRGVTFEVDSKYEVIKAIGMGAYGLVCSAQDLETKQYVAIKKIPKIFDDLVDGKRVLRELKLLRMIRHPNVIKMHGVLTPREGFERFRDVYIVSELMDTNLHTVIRSSHALNDDHQRYFMYQLFHCLAYVHANGVIHRDLKPGNLLLSKACDLKLCDFGLARGGLPYNTPDRRPSSSLNSPQDAGFQVLSPAQQNVEAQRVSANLLRHSSLRNANSSATSIEPPTKQAAPPPPEADANEPLDLTEYVVTRWYRPPELLLMSRYNHAVDLWSAGCVLAEMILRKPLFPGKDYLGQLRLICRLVAPPESDDELEVIVDRPESRRFVKEMRSQFHDRHGPRDSQADQLALFAAVLPKANPDAVDLLHSLLAFNPTRRITAKEAMRHPFFRSLYHPGDELELSSTAVEPAALQRAQWEFENCTLEESDLRVLFWREIQRRDRRAKRTTRGPSPALTNPRK
jgi:serine/threonine protein kinase